METAPRALPFIGLPGGGSHPRALTLCRKIKKAVSYTLGSRRPTAYSLTGCVEHPVTYALAWENTLGRPGAPAGKSSLYPRRKTTGVLQPNGVTFERCGTILRRTALHEGYPLGRMASLHPQIWATRMAASSVMGG